MAEFTQKDLLFFVLATKTIQTKISELHQLKYNVHNKRTDRADIDKTIARHSYTLQRLGNLWMKMARQAKKAEGK